MNTIHFLIRLRETCVRMAGSGAVSAPRLPVLVATLQYASNKVILEKRLNVLAQGPGMVFICGVMQSFLLTSNEYLYFWKKIS